MNTVGLPPAQPFKAVIVQKKGVAKAERGLSLRDWIQSEIVWKDRGLLQNVGGPSGSGEESWSIQLEIGTDRRSGHRPDDRTYGTADLRNRSSFWGSFQHAGDRVANFTWPSLGQHVSPIERSTAMLTSRRQLTRAFLRVGLVTDQGRRKAALVKSNGVPVESDAPPARAEVPSVAASAKAVAFGVLADGKTRSSSH